MEQCVKMFDSQRAEMMFEPGFGTATTAQYRLSKTLKQYQIRYQYAKKVLSVSAKKAEYKCSKNSKIDLLLSPRKNDAKFNISTDGIICIDPKYNCITTYGEKFL